MILYTLFKYLPELYPFIGFNPSWDILLPHPSIENVRSQIRQDPEKILISIKQEMT